MSPIASLFKSISLYLQQEWEEGRITLPTSQKESIIPSTKPPIAQAEKKPSPPKEEYKQPEPKPKPVLPPPSHSFERTPLAPAESKSLEEMRLLMSRVLPQVRWNDRTLTVAVLFFDDIPTHRTFLQSVCKALITLGYSAELVCLSSIQEAPPCDLLLAPLSKINEKAQGKVHEIVEWKKGQWVFPLAQIDSYLQDVNLKRALWNALKTTPSNMRQSSST